MRAAAFFVLTLTLIAQPVLAERKDSTPLVKAPPTVAPCLTVCESEFARCESEPQATSKICPESRQICIERCDPAVLSSDTLRGLKRTPEELRYKPLSPQSPVEQCRQGCQDRRATCLSSNTSETCSPATEACYARCDKPSIGKPAK